MLVFIILDYFSRGVMTIYLTSTFIGDTPSSNPLDLQLTVKCVIVRSLSLLLMFFKNYMIVLLKVSPLVTSIT